MDLTYGCLAVKGTSWTHEDNIAMQLANTVCNLRIFGQFNMFLLN